MSLKCAQESEMKRNENLWTNSFYRLFILVDKMFFKAPQSYKQEGLLFLYKLFCILFMFIVVLMNLDITTLYMAVTKWALWHV